MYIVSLTQRNKGSVARLKNRGPGSFATGHIMAAHSVTLTGWGGGGEAQRCPPASTTSCLIAH